MSYWPYASSVLPETLTPGVTTGHIVHSVDLMKDLNRRNKGAEGVGLKRHGGLLGNGTDETTAFDAFTASLHALAPRRFKVYAEDGTYGLQPLRVIPWNISLESVNAHGATLKDLGTTPTSFLVPRGSRSSIAGFVIDANKSAISLPNLSMDSFVAVGLTKPGSLSGGGSTLAGGLVLGAGVSAGVSAITTTVSYSGASSPVTGRSPILPGDVLSICQGALYERVRVAAGFVIGNTSGAGGSCAVPLEGQLVNSYTTAANITQCATDVSVLGNWVYGAGIQGIGMYECIVADNVLTNQIDCALGHFDRGNYGNRWDRNVVETYSYWAYFEDDFTQLNAIYPPNENNSINNPMFRFLRGGPDVGTGPGAGNVELIGQGGGTGLTITGGVLDYSAATGPTLHGAIRFNPACVRPRVKGTKIIGGNQANTAGIYCITLTGTDNNIDPHISDVDFQNNLIGVDLGQATSGSVLNSRFRGGTAYGINQVYGRSDAAVALFIFDGNDSNGGVAGIRMSTGGSYPAGSGYRGQNVITNASFAPIAMTAAAVHDPAGQSY